MLEPTDVAILAVVAYATAVLSAVVGMAGGIVLLSVMLLFVEPLVAIPLHGVVQLASNGSRSIVQRRHIRWDIVGLYAIPLLPFGLLGYALLRELPADVARTAVGVFVLLATWAPGVMLLGTRPERANPRRRFLALGAVAGVMNVSIGAIGPLIAPFFLNLGLTRFALIGTKAAAQMLGHLAKIAIFGVAGFAFGSFALVLGLLCASVVAGTWSGSRLLEHVDEKLFVHLYKTVLTAIALRLVVAPLLE